MKVETNNTPNPSTRLSTETQQTTVKVKTEPAPASKSAAAVSEPSKEQRSALENLPQELQQTPTVT